MGYHKQGFDNLVLDPPRHQKLNACQPKSQPFQEQHRYKEEGLVLDDKPENAPFFQRLLLSEGKHREICVRVQKHMVGIVVVPIMLIKPPRTLQRQQEANEEAENFVVTGGMKDLPMARVMAYESQLGERQGEQAGIGVLNPHVIYKHQDGNAEGQKGQRGAYLEGVECRLPVHQPSLFD